MTSAMSFSSLRRKVIFALEIKVEGPMRHCVRFSSVQVMSEPTSA